MIYQEGLVALKRMLRASMNQQEKDPPPESMKARCPLCQIRPKTANNKAYIESLVLHVVGEHKRSIEEANDLIARYVP